VSAGRLLLVDDEDDIRLVAAMSLERVGGWTVVPAASGAAALDAAATQGPFDAVLLDVMMPGLDGPTTLARLRDGPLPDDVPIIFLTAKAHSAERERLVALGAAGVLSKPFDPMRLPQDVERIVRPGA
jgi:two-component system OmpR family response regulator